MMAHLFSLIERWRAEANLFRRYGAIKEADLLETVARDAELAAAAEGRTLLTRGEAAERTGYSVDHLGRLLRERKIPNAGRKNAPRVRLSDLPRRRSLPKGINDAYDPAADARSLMSRRNGGADGDSNPEA